MPLTPSLTCRLAVAALGVLLSLPPAAAASCSPARVPPSAEYLDLVSRYAAGDHDLPVQALGTWSKDRLRCDLDNLRGAALAARRSPQGEDRQVFERFSLRAAILLHADREIANQFGDPVSEQDVNCGTSQQAGAIERLADMLMMVDPEGKPFLSRFYEAMAHRAQWSHCLREAELWGRTGLRRLPRDARLLLAVGSLVETTAFLTLVPAPRTATLGPRALREFEAQNAALGNLWERARKTFADAVAADPDLHEARLRLGRTLWRLKKPEPARAGFEEVLARSRDSALLYLAHLFLGRVEEDQGDFEKAEKEYRGALALDPRSEPAAVAISHVRLLRGDPDGARESLMWALGAPRRRTDLDPYKHYLMTHAEDGDRSLTELRRSVLP